MKKIRPSVYQLQLGAVNAFLFDHGELTLVDTGYSGNWEKISNSIKGIGKTPEQLKHVLITHLHPDHTGSLAKIKQETNAKIYMHPEDATLVAAGKAFRENITITPGFVHSLIFRLFIKGKPTTVEPVETDVLINDGDVIDIGKGFRVIHAPGHCKGQVALLYQDYGGVLIAADTAGNIMGLNPAPFYEDLEQGYRDLENMCELDFQHAVFGHGKALIGNADKVFRKSFKK